MAVRACDNPFSVSRIEKIPYHFKDSSFERLLIKLGELNYRAVITGPHGSGKTTLLEQLQNHLEDAGHKILKVFINDAMPMTFNRANKIVSELDCEQIVMIDGADLINKIMWVWFKAKILRSAKGLIIISHKPGLLPTLIECSTSETLLCQIVQGLLGPDAKIDEKQMNHLFSQNNGDFRRVLSELYDRY